MVVGVGKPDVGTHQVDSQQIALKHPARVPAQHDRGAQPHLPGRRRGQTGMVALRTATGDQHRRAGRLRLRHFVLELAWLITAQRQVGQVVPLEIQVQVEPRACVRQAVERRRRPGQRRARIAGECAVDGGHHRSMIAFPLRSRKMTCRSVGRCIAPAIRRWSVRSCLAACRLLGLGSQRVPAIPCKSPFLRYFGMSTSVILTAVFSVPRSSGGCHNSLGFAVSGQEGPCCA